MCGICGVVFGPRNEDAQECVRSMAAAMSHRGPDGEGFLFDEARVPGIALGMRRLSVIDLPGGNQPIWNESRDVAVIFNGELYNYRQLREALALCGHEFSTQSDTEILVHAWEEWGEDCLTELRGMFAFALLDFRAKHAAVPILFLARDPLGIKPLYYTQTPEGFAFASEVRALLGCRIVFQTTFTGCAYVVPAFWQHFRTGDTARWRFFFAAGASDDAAHPGTTQGAAGTSVVRRDAEPGRS